MLTSRIKYDYYNVSGSCVRKSKYSLNIGPSKSMLPDTAHFLTWAFFRAKLAVQDTDSAMPNGALAVLEGQKRLGSVWDFTTKDMAAKAVSGHGRFDTQPSHTSIRCSAENGRAKVARTMSLKWLILSRTSTGFTILPDPLNMYALGLFHRNRKTKKKRHLGN